MNLAWLHERGDNYPDACRKGLAAMMEAGRLGLCGAKNVPDAGRKAVRGGTTRIRSRHPAAFNNDWDLG